jgi:hypothetical protein
MAILGAKPLNPPAAQAPQAEPEPDTPELAAARAAEQAAVQQFEAELDGHLAHLKSIDPNDPNFATDMLTALDAVDDHVGHSDARIAELRDGLRRGIAAKARADLEEHLNWAETTFPPGTDRSRAALHGFNLYLDQLDPDVDAETIAFGRQALGLDMPTPDSDEL